MNGCPVHIYVLWMSFFPWGNVVHRWVLRVSNRDISGVYIYARCPMAAGSE